MKKRYNYITSACFIALGVYVIIESAGYKNKGFGQQNPGLWPTVLAGVMIVCCVALIIQTAAKKTDEAALKQQDLERKIAEARAEAEKKGEEFDEKLFVQNLKQKEVDEGGILTELQSGSTDIDWTSPGMKRAYAAIGMVIGFFIIQYFFGMLIGLACLVPGIMWLMNTKKLLTYIVTDAGVIAFVYIFFAKVMTITLPVGILF
ncbi:MAG: tripartite tricarboxylate transporter TctB family protein [Bilifractor sp.]